MKSILFEFLSKTLLNFFLNHQIELTSETKLTVCLSGGVDSIALLYLLKKMQNQYSFDLKALHVQHNIRSQEEGQNELIFIQDFCSQYQIPLNVKKIKTGELVKKAKEEGRSLEEVAREARYFLFNKYHQKNLGWLLTAHHQNDNHETLLQRFFEGAGISGLKGIPEHKDFYLRPFLNISRETINEFLKENKIKGIEDTSNFDESFFRNRIRHRIIPFLKKEIPSIEEAFNRILWKLQRAHEVLNSLPRIPFYPLKSENEGYFVLLNEWEKFSQWQQMECLYEIFQKMLEGNDSDRISFDFLRQILEHPGGERFYRGIFIRWGDDRIYFFPQGRGVVREIFSFEIRNPGVYSFPWGDIKVELSNKSDKNADFSHEYLENDFIIYCRSINFGEHWNGRVVKLSMEERLKGIILESSKELFMLKTPNHLLRKEVSDLEKNQFFNYYIKYCSR